MDQVASETKVEPSLKLNFLSHGTLISADLEATREFYEQFFGLEVVRTSPISMMVRLGGQHVYAVVHRKNHTGKMDFLFHNGLDVESEDDVNEAHATAVAEADKWGLTQISKPKLQHGTYSFLFWDRDGNCWEILSNPTGGYTWIFEQGDQEGRGHMDKKFAVPGLSKD